MAVGLHGLNGVPVQSLVLAEQEYVHARVPIRPLMVVESPVRG